MHKLFAKQLRRQLLTLPLGEVAALDFGLGKRRGAPLRVGVVERADLAEEDNLRPFVENDVVNDDMEDVVVCGQPDQPGPEQVRAVEVDRALRLLVDKPKRRPLRVRLAGNVGPLDREREAVGDDLHRPTLLERKARAERLVPPHDLHEGALKRVRVKAPVEPDRPGEVVREVARRELVHEPELLLSERAAPDRTAVGAHHRRERETRSRLCARGALRGRVADARHTPGFSQPKRKGAQGATRGAGRSRRDLTRRMLVRDPGGRLWDVGWTFPGVPDRLVRVRNASPRRPAGGRGAKPNPWFRARGAAGRVAACTSRSGRWPSIVLPQRRVVYITTPP